MNIPELVVGIDFETYFDEDYTLKKMSTTEYVRHELFKAQCFAIRTNLEDEARYYRGDQLDRVLGQYDWSTTALLAHHAHFDGFILSHHYKILPAYAYCTLSMARPLHGGKIRNDLDTLSKHYGGRGKIQDVLGETLGVRTWDDELFQKAGAYCAQDVDEMWRIFREMLIQYPEDELDLINHTVKCYIDPVFVVNEEKCKKEHDNELTRKAALYEKVGLDAKWIRSREYFAQLLRYSGVEPPIKKSPSTGKPTYAFAQADLAFQALSVHPNQRIRNLVAARSAASSNLSTTRAARLLLHATPRLPIYLAYGRAHTLRWGGGDKCNPQNLPRDGRLRACLEAPPGHRLVVIDSAQIEARLNAWLAGQTDLLDQFRAYDKGDKSQDPYKRFAAESVYHKAVEAILDPERFLGKVAILGLGYHMGGPKFQYTLAAGLMGPPTDVDLEEAYRVVNAYRARYPHISAQWKTFDRLIHTLWGGGTAMEYGPLVFEKQKVWLPNEMYLRYPGLHRRFNEESGFTEWRYNGNEKLYGGLLTENLVQALARIVVAWQLLQLAEKWRLALMVHDEGVFCVLEELAEECLREAEEIFGIPPSWCPDLPCAGEGIITKEYRKP